MKFNDCSAGPKQTRRPFDEKKNKNKKTTTAKPRPDCLQEVTASISIVALSLLALPGLALPQQTRWRRRHEIKGRAASDRVKNVKPDPTMKWTWMSGVFCLCNGVTRRSTAAALFVLSEIGLLDFVPYFQVHHQSLECPQNPSSPSSSTASTFPSSLAQSAVHWSNNRMIAS